MSLESKPADEGARAARIIRWSAFSCALGLATDVLGFVLAVLDIGSGDDSILAAVTLAVAFTAIFFGLIGLFMMQLAREMPGAPPAPRWAIPCGIASIPGGLFVGLFGLIT